MNLDQNPFSAITQKLMGGGQAPQDQAQPQMPMPQQGGMMGGQGQQKVPPQPTDVTQPDVNPDHSKPLIQMLNLSNKFIETVTSAEDAQKMRLIIGLLSSMIIQDQETQHEAVSKELGT